MPSSSPHSRWLGGISLVLVLGAFVVWIGYAWIGESLIHRIHQGQLGFPFSDRPILNPDKPVDFYLRLGGLAVRGGVVYVLLLLSIIRLAYGWIFAPEKRPWVLMVCGLWIVACVYLINPEVRIVSVHGLIHTGIVYQILNGGLPPDNPLLAGQPLRYPWGFHACAAAVCRMFQVSPGWSFALINLVSLGACMMLIARIARCLIRDTAVQVYAVAVSLFMTGLICRPVLDYLSNVLGYPLEFRALFAGQKFTKINGVPIGLVFFMLLVYSLIRLVQGRHWRRYSLCLLVAAVGCGYLYPLMYPAVCASGGIVALHRVWEGVRSRRFRWIPLLQILIPLILSMALVVPFLNMIAGQNLGQKIQILNPGWFFRSGFNVLLRLGPITAVIILAYRDLRCRWNPHAATVLILVIVACLGCYLGIHMFNEAEYKFLILLDVGVGILGGLAVSTLRTRLHPAWMLGLLLVFGSPVAVDLGSDLRPYSWSRTPKFLERGTTLSFFDPPQEALCRWIRENTPTNAVFMDTKLDIPCCGRGCLYLAWTGVENPDRIESGYNISMQEFLGLESGYSSELLRRRGQFLHQLYSPDQPISDALLDEIRKFDSLYIVVRDPGLFPRFDGNDFQTVFSDSSGRIRVVRLRSQ
jgi:hypothetical protein